jgi:predicted aspartyl protease
MEISTVGKVVVTAKIENLADVHLAINSHRPPNGIRSLEVADAVVSPHATTLSIPRRLIAQLGLRPHRTRRVRTAAGMVTCQIYEAVRLTIQERECSCDVLELPDGCPIVVGKVPLGMLDFVIDFPKGKLIGNPAHDGEHQVEVY